MAELMMSPAVDALHSPPIAGAAGDAGAADRTTPRRVFITAAEVSGDRHAAQFIRSLRQILPDVQVEGLGGPEMEAAGAKIHRNTVTNAAMGWRGALRALEVYKVLRWTRQHFDTQRPDLWVGVDSPSMNFHFARAAHERGIPTLQFVAPQLWAWAPWRMQKLRNWVDRVACIMPFEESYFRSHAVNARFVGHPLFDELPAGRTLRNGEPAVPRVPQTIGLLPGSRRSIAQANFPRLLEVAAVLLRRFPSLQFLIPTTTATDPVVKRVLAGGAIPPDRVRVELDAFDRLVPLCDLCLTVSGTATLHVASYGVPMIVVYAGNPVLWNLLGRWLIRTRTYAMVNLLADPTPLEPDPTHSRHLVREFIPWFGPTGPVADLATQYLRDPAKLAAQRAKLVQMVARLDHPGASDEVARMAVELMQRAR
jgi:lipid-A-disaccharide synthase